MKRFSIFALAAVAMFVGCTKDIDTDIVKENDIVRGELVTKTLVIEDSRVERDEVSGKLSWNEGDQVAVVLKNGSTYSLDTEKYTVNFVNGEAQLEIPSNTVYAIYPATIATGIKKDSNNNPTNIVNLTLPETYTVATPEDIFNHNPMRGIIEGDKILFNNLMGFVKVPLTGEGTLNALTVKSEIFNGFKPISNAATLDASDANVGITMATNNEARAWVKVKFSDGLSLSASPAVYVPVPEETYGNMALVVETDKGATTIYAKNSHKVNRSAVKPVSANAINVDSHTPASPTSLSGTTGTSYNDYANTYIVPPTAGEYAFEAKLVDGTELEGGVTAEIVWAEEAGMFYDFHYNPTDKVISFKTNGKKGNALIALSKNNFGTQTIVWSWLLWCTDTPEDITTLSTSYTYMDRVLGATWAPGTLADQRTEKGWTEAWQMNGSVSSTDATDACGLYYQYQNMIPYPRIKDIDYGAKTKNKTETDKLENTRIGVQYGFQRYCQYWTSTQSGSTISTDSNGQYRTAASYNLSYMYSITDASSNQKHKAWTYSSLYGGKPTEAVPEGAYRLWNINAAGSTGLDLSYKSNHDPCPKGYAIDHYSALFWGVSKRGDVATRTGFVRNPENDENYTAGYRVYGMYFSGCTNKSGGTSTNLYYPCASNRSGNIVGLGGNWGNMGYIYTHNTDAGGKTAYTITTKVDENDSSKNETMTAYQGANMQYGASNSGALGNPSCSSTKNVNAQAYNVRCLKKL